MVTDLIKNNKAYQYALWCVDDNNDKVGKYVKKQCQEFIDSVENEDSKYYVNEKELKAIEGFLKLINIMPYDLAVKEMKEFAKKNYSKFGEKVLEQNEKNRLQNIESLSVIGAIILSFITICNVIVIFKKQKTMK